jgi:phosphate uptake regulator
MAEVTIDNATHEAAHATVARLLGLPVVSATAALPKPLVRTLHRPLVSLDLEKEAKVALVGLALDSTPEGIEADLRNARQYAGQLVLIRHGLAGGVKLTEELKAEVAELMERLRISSAALVEENKDAVDRVARVLMTGATMNQTDIDAAILAPEKAEQIATRLVEATQDFVEALFEIGEAKGADAEDDFERAVNCIKNMQRTARDVLRRHGFEPRGSLVE